MKDLTCYVELMDEYLPLITAANPSGPFPEDMTRYMNARYGLQSIALMLPRLRRALLHNRSDFPIAELDRLMESVDDDKILLELHHENIWYLICESYAPLTALKEKLADRLLQAPESMYRWALPAQRSRTIEAVRARREDILALATTYGMTHVRVFGSVARGDDRPDSDVDFLATFPEGLNWDTAYKLQRAVAAIVGREVDWVNEAELRPGGMRDNILREAIPL